MTVLFELSSSMKAIPADHVSGDARLEYVKIYRFLFLCVLLLGLLLRAYHIDYNLDGDEVVSVKAASGSFSHAVAASIYDKVHPPLHTILLYVWIKVFGNSEAAVRTLSVLVSAVFLFTLYRLSLKLTKVLSALFVVLICAISPFFIYYGQQARPYSLVACFSALSMYFLLKSQEEPLNQQRKWLYGLSCAGLVYSQYLGILILLPQFVSLWLRREREYRTLLIYGLVGMLSVIPWLLVLGSSLMPEKLTSIHWISRPEPFDLAVFYIGIFGWLPAQGTGRVLLLLIAIAYGSLLLKRNIVTPKVLTIISIAVFPPLAIWLISRFGPVSVWATRQMIGSAVFFICLLGIAHGLHGRFVRVFLAFVLAGWCILTLPSGFPEATKPPWQYIASLLGEKVNDVDIVSPEPWFVIPLSYYSGREIYYWKDYAVDRTGKDRHVVYLCRPRPCEGLKELRESHKVRDEKTIDWVGLGKSPDTTIKIYYLDPIPTSP